MLEFITDDIVLLDGDYFLYIDNTDCGALSELVPLHLGPKVPYSPEIPF